MVLLQVGLERRALRLVAEGSTSIGHQIGVVLGHALLLAPHAPAYIGDTTEKDSTTNAANDTADDGPVGGAETARAVATVSR